MEEEGIITELKGEMARVAITPKSACAHCSARAICIQSGDEVYTEAINPLGAQVGDMVKVEMPAGSVYRSTFLLFLMPLVILALGFGLARRVGLPQGISILVGTCLAGGWFVLLGRIEKRKSQRRPRPVIKGFLNKKK